MVKDSQWIERFKHSHPTLEPCLPDVLHAFEILGDCYAAGGKLLVCGNGGSAADSEHIVSELMKGYLLKRSITDTIQNRLLEVDPEHGNELANQLQMGLPAISLISQLALISAISNDISPDLIFAQQVLGYGKPGDVLWSISTSGDASNIIAAFQTAKALDVNTIALTGPSGGAAISMADVAICVPGESTPEIQENHRPVYHLLCELLEEEFFT